MNEKAKELLEELLNQLIHYVPDHEQEPLHNMLTEFKEELDK